MLVQTFIIIYVYKYLYRLSIVRSSSHRMVGKHSTYKTDDIALEGTAPFRLETLLNFKPHNPTAL